MKLAVLVPSQEYKTWAGARIRYNRIRPHLAASGIDLTLEDIGQFNPLTSDCDTVLISKCHDPKSLVVAALISNRGKSVGIDLFDDYFSVATDSRLVRYRNWLSEIVQSSNFALGGTKSMTNVVQRLRSDLPTHVMNDPAPEYDVGGLSLLVEKKLRDTRDSNLLKVVWFGTGDNAFFPVGLADLSAFGSVLGELNCSGMDVELTVLTNARALSAEGLSLIKALPVRTLVMEWSEEAEDQALHDATLAFLPVNAQGFSVAKSLNRAITALSAGCQVLSVGYPLYAPLDKLVYRDPKTFMMDVAAGSLRLSGNGLAEYVDRMNALANPAVEAQKLAKFLFGLKPGAAPPPVPLNLVHGHATLADAHRLVQEAGGFSVASPFCSAPLDFDVVFRAKPSGVDMFVSQLATRRLSWGKAAHLQPRQKIGGREYSLVDHADSAPPAISFRNWYKPPLPVEFATYKATMRQIHVMMTESFGPVRTIVSETSQLPFSV